MTLDEEVLALARRRGPARGIPLRPVGRPMEFDGLAYTGNLVAVRNFPAGCVIDLSGLRWGPLLPVLLDHDFKRPCGWCEGGDVGVVDGSKLLVSGRVLPAEFPAAATVLEARRDRVRWELSLGVRATDAEMDVSLTDWLVANGLRIPPRHPIVRRGELREVSFVRAGADPRTLVLWKP